MSLATSIIISAIFILFFIAQIKIPQLRNYRLVFYPALILLVCIFEIINFFNDTNNSKILNAKKKTELKQIVNHYIDNSGQIPEFYDFKYVKEYEVRTDVKPPEFVDKNLKIIESYIAATDKKEALTLERKILELRKSWKEDSVAALNQEGMYFLTYFYNTEWFGKYHELVFVLNRNQEVIKSFEREPVKLRTRVKKRFKIFGLI